MRFALFALPAFAASVLAAEVSVTWRHEPSTNSTSLTVHSADKEVLAEKCGSSIESLDFSQVNEKGAGFFTVGKNKFRVQNQPQGSLVCNRIYNSDMAVAECTGIDLDLSTLRGAAKSADCFVHDHVKDSFRRLKSRSVDILTATPHVEQPNITADIESPTAQGWRPTMPSFLSRITGRQTSCFQVPVALVVDGGNPHQNFLNKQVTELNDCGEGTCSVGEQKSKTYGISASFELIPLMGKIFAKPWTKGSFAVQQQWTTGNTHVCNGEKGDKVCLWYITAHTAYTVGGSQTSNCYIKPNGPNKPYWIWKSPNENNRGGNYHCVHGDGCKAQGDEFWDNSGRAGGP